jgi:hypothetical protein
MFGQQQIGSASASQQVTLTNTGDVALSLIAASTTGDFSVVNGCGNSLNGHSSCSMSVSFNPHDVGAETGVLTVADEFRSQAVGLSGVGVAPQGVSLAPTVGLSFGATGVGVTSAAQMVTLTNHGGSALTISGVSVAGDFVIAANGCGSMLAQGAACAVQVVFAPTVGGVRSGTLTVMHSAAGSPQTVVLSGAGVDFSLALDGPISLAVSSGQSAVFPLLVGSAAEVRGTVALSCAGAPAHSVCTVVPASVTLGSTTLVRVTVQTGNSAASVPSVGRGVWWALMLPVGWLAVRRRRLGVVVLLCWLVAVAGCGAAREIPGTGDSGGGGGVVVTPSGSYSIVVTGSSVGLNRVLNLTLEVR